MQPSQPFNLAAHCIGAQAATLPNKTALVVLADAHPGQPSEVWTYAELEDAILKTAGGLKALGLEPGARIMIRLENTSAYAILFFGAIAAGLVALPTSNQLTDAEALFLLENSRASALAAAQPLDTSTFANPPRFLSPDLVAHMIANGPRATYAPTTQASPAYLIYTSGTTARPKGVLHAQRAILGRQPMYDGWYGIRESDRVLHAGAFNWTFTLGTGLMDPWANGATAIVFTGEKDPALWPHLIAKTEATLFAAVPGLFRQMLKYANPTAATMPTLRHALMAGETPPPGLFEDWKARTGLNLFEALGMSEISTYISTSPSVPRKPGTVGKPQAGRTIAILPAEGGETPLPPETEGLIAVHRSDPGLMLGYWQRPEEEAEVFRGEWFTGGDLGTLDDEGYITHTGRANDIMKALGYRVSPLEVEAVLAGHPAVAEVAAAELAVRPEVNVICAYVVPRPDVSLDKDTILEFGRTHLASYKAPREVRFLAALPRTANGKVRRRGLSEQPELTSPLEKPR